jgi:hypothetical protein
MIRQIGIIAFVLLLLARCSDTVTKHYSTRTEAEADRLFDRGWLPRIIPTSSKQIRTSNDLDINTSRGEFHYDVNESGVFMANLREYSARKAPFRRWTDSIREQKKEGYTAFEYSDKQSVWVFFVNPKKGHVRYAMWLLKEAS